MLCYESAAFFSDNGELWLSAHNRHPATAEIFSQLTIRSPAMCPFHCVQLTPDGNASIECLAFGDPAPRVSWFKDSRRLTVNDSSVRLPQVDASDARYVISHVLLRHVTRDDAGDYK